jgi:hypothetical protein
LWFSGGFIHLFRGELFAGASQLRDYGAVIWT